MAENPEHIWFLLSRHLSGESTAEEFKQLQDWLNESGDHRKQYELLQQVWQFRTEQPAASSEQAKISRILQLAAVEEALLEKTEPVTVSPARKIFTPVRIVALTVVVMALGWVFTHWMSSTAEKENTVVAEKGSKTRAILPDGSTVWLNAGSSIHYTPAFNSKIREVTLYGEAYFDVVKDAARPFIVHAGSIQIKVLGTSFNVKSYPEDSTVETTLIKGLVQILSPGKSAPVYLRPNQKIVMSATGDDVVENMEQQPAAKPSLKDNAAAPAIAYLDSNLRDNEREEIAWLFNRLEFRGDNFISLGKKLERWFNITIRFEDEKVKQLVFNGSLENESVLQAFEALKAAVPFTYSINGNEISIGSYQQNAP